jgi:hypothetical protein
VQAQVSSCDGLWHVPGGPPWKTHRQGGLTSDIPMGPKGLAFAMGEQTQSAPWSHGAPTDASILTLMGRGGSGTEVGGARR